MFFDDNLSIYVSGFLTSKGELVRAILYPKPVDFKFNKDTYFFVGVLAFIAGIGLVYTVVLKVWQIFLCPWNQRFGVL